MSKPTPIHTIPNIQVSLVNHQGEHTLWLDEYSDNQGLILYFYPKDNTAGCTLQATDFSALQDKFDQLGYKIIGVSRDDVKSHQRFIQQHNLSIDLISDPDEKLCRLFDVIKIKQLYGKSHLGVVRSTFVFDNNKTLIHAYPNVKAKDHAQKLLDLLGNQSVD